jgi:2-polyprenyl-3-methyl-5-hydroxy-6-metoxy-1,4-benzoquinol methylase
MDHAEVDFDTVARALIRSDWIFAKTMPWCPHYYTLRRNWKQPVSFDVVVHFMRQHSYREKFGRQCFQRFDVNDMKYWTMGAPIPETILINRAFIGPERVTEYCHIAEDYDSYFTDPASLEQNRVVMEMIDYRPEETVLDVGCRTGLFFDYAHPGDNYLGIDSSFKMLEVLRRRHPQAAVLHSKLDCFYTEMKFDLVVSLFGAASYASPEAIQRIPHLLKPGGRYFLMFYAPGYEPVTYKLSGRQIPHYDFIPNLLPGKCSSLNGFNITMGVRES